MKLSVKNISCVLLVLSILLIALLIPTSLYASAKAADDVVVEEQTVAVAEAEESTTETTEKVEKVDNEVTKHKAWAAAIVVGIVAVAGAIGMAMVISKSVEGIARQPEADGKIRTTLMLGLVFIETAIIYALIVAILLIFVM